MKYILFAALFCTGLCRADNWPNWRGPDGNDICHEKGVPVKWDKGNILWNSHAFNLTRRDGKLEAWVNIYFPTPEEQENRKRQIFDISKIFWGDLFSVLSPIELAPFEEFEVCQVHLFGSGARFSIW